MTDWASVLARWQEEFDCKVLAPTCAAIREAALEAVGPVPPDMIALYKVMNGLTLEDFTVLPIEDRGRVKQTWDGLLRANAPGKSKYMGGDETLLKRFLVFGQFYGRACIAIERDNGVLWIEEEKKEGNVLFETTLDLEHCIEMCLREIYDDVI